MLINKLTAQQLSYIQSAMPHAVLLTGQPGCGQNELAIDFAKQLIGAKYAYNTTIFGQNESITIENVREIKNLVKLKTVGDQMIRRVVIFLNAHTANDESQNALLKLLEEPPYDTCIILATDNEHAIKQTIHSRVQTVQVLPVELPDCLEQYAAIDKAKVTSAYHLAEGRAAYIEDIITNEDSQISKSVATAKLLIGSTVFERLTWISSKTDAVSLPQLLFVMKRICVSARNNAADTAKAKLWNDRIGQLIKADERLTMRANEKLVLTNLLSNL